MSNFRSVNFPKIWTGRQKRKVARVKKAGDAYQNFMSAYLPDAGGKNLAKTENQKWTMARQ